MKKIYWNLSKEKFDSTVKNVMICNECGWLVSNPKLEEKGKRPPFDTYCPNCRKSYKETKSELKPIKHRKSK